MRRKKLPAECRNKLTGFWEVAVIAMGTEKEGKGGRKRAGKLRGTSWELEVHRCG